MKYILVQNNGLIQLDDLKLIGSSSKRTDSTKIGMFGSGWKYALAWLIRNDATPKIFSGVEEIIVSNNYKLHRDNPVRVITFNGEESSLTAEMGPKWEGWMAFREIFSNAVDEGGEKITLNVDESEIDTEGGVSRVYIPMVDALAKVINEFDTYFAFNKVSNYSNSVAKMYIHSEKKELVTFRKGIRCYNERYTNTNLSLDFVDIDINEDRLADNWDVRKKYQAFMSSCDNVKILKTLIQGCAGVTFFPDVCSDHMVTAFKELNVEGIKFTTQELSRMLPTGQGAVLVPGKLLEDMVKREIIDHPLSKYIKNSLGFMFIDEEHAEDKCREVRYYLSEVLAHVNVKIGAMNDTCKYIIDYVDEEKTINRYTFYISSSYAKDKEQNAKVMAARCLIDLDEETVIAKLFN